MIPISNIEGINGFLPVWKALKWPILRASAMTHEAAKSNSNDSAPARAMLQAMSLSCF